MSVTRKLHLPFPTAAAAASTHKMWKMSNVAYILALTCAEKLAHHADSRPYFSHVCRKIVFTAFPPRS